MAAPPLADAEQSWPGRHNLDVDGTWGGAPPSPRSPGISDKSISISLTQEPSGPGGRSADDREEPFCSPGNVAAAGTATLGVGFVASCVVALVLQYPIAAGLAAVGAWLSWQALVLHRDCRGLRAKLRTARQAGADGSRGKKGSAAPSALVAPLKDERSDLDLTGYARTLGLTLPGAGLQPEPGQPGHTMEAVMLSALVNEYLRNVATLKQYQASYGHLPDAPPADPSFAVAEALMSGLGLGGAPTAAAGQPPQHAFSGLYGDAPTPSLGPPRSFDFQPDPARWDEAAQAGGSRHRSAGSRSPSPARSVTFGGAEGVERRGRSPPKDKGPAPDAQDPATGSWAEYAEELQRGSPGGACGRSASQPLVGTPRGDHERGRATSQERATPGPDAPPLRFNKPVDDEEKPDWLKPRPRSGTSPAPAPLSNPVDRPSWLPPRRG